MELELKQIHRRRAERIRPSFTTTFDEQLLENLDGVCEEIGCTRTAAMEAAVKMWLAAVPHGKAPAPDMGRGGQLPYGKTRVDGQIVEVKDEVETIVIAKRLRGDGHSFGGISKMLADAGWFARNGKPFFAAQIRNMIGEASK